MLYILYIRFFFYLVNNSHLILVLLMVVPAIHICSGAEFEINFVQISLAALTTESLQLELRESYMMEKNVMKRKIFYQRKAECGHLSCCPGEGSSSRVKASRGEFKFNLNSLYNTRQ